MAYRRLNREQITQIYEMLVEWGNVAVVASVISSLVNWRAYKGFWRLAVIAGTFASSMAITSMIQKLLKQSMTEDVDAFCFELERLINDIR